MKHCTPCNTIKLIIITIILLLTKSKWNNTKPNGSGKKIRNLTLLRRETYIADTLTHLATGSLSQSGCNLNGEQSYVLHPLIYATIWVGSSLKSRTKSKWNNTKPNCSGTKYETEHFYVAKLIADTLGNRFTQSVGFPFWWWTIIRFAPTNLWDNLGKVISRITYQIEMK